MAYLTRRNSAIRRWLLIATGAALALLLLAAACGGGEEEGGPQGTKTARETAAATETATEEGGDGGGEVGAAKLQDLAKATEGITAKVTYRFTSSIVGGQESEFTMTLTQRPPDSRIDYSFSEPGQPATATSVIQVGDASYLCTDLGGGEGTCLSVPADQAQQQTDLFEPIFSTTESLAEDIEGFDLVDESERTIAGVTAKCFTVKATSITEFASAETCISEDGILLLSKVTLEDGSETSIEATEVSTDVTDADFQPPFEVTELPG
ncbi:MAG: hypothetical protein HYY03_05005 [Chloroflexi bacterium]|nr:hypothetical protein [Chloroflexota bacterium]